MELAVAQMGAVATTKEELSMSKSGHNSELTDAERRALRIHYAQSLIQVDNDMAPLHALRKKIRGEAKAKFKLSEIDATKRLMTMEDQSIFVAELKELFGIAQDMNAIPPSDQPDLFADRRPADELAFDAGKQAGRQGKNPEAPAGYDPTKWMEGWHEGQRERRDELQSAMEKINATMEDEDPDFADAAE